MSSADFCLPETKILSISSHVVSGYVGNTMASIVMQSLGCDVAAINTVQLSNHLGYGQARGPRTNSSDIIEIWKGLCEADLNDFDILYSGYLPDDASIGSVMHIIRESRESLKELSSKKLFWLLDPVMGDNGKLYVSDTIIPLYKRLLPHADLITPNQFEAEVLTDVKIIDIPTLYQAISFLHSRYEVPHVVITSLTFNCLGDVDSTLLVAGSSTTSTKIPRVFTVKVPKIDCLFSGTGDMFAAILLVRLRQIVCETPELEQAPHWLSEDDVEAIQLPLAKATEKALASTHDILSKSKSYRDKKLSAYYAKIGGVEKANSSESLSKNHRLTLVRTSEIRIVRNLSLLKNPSQRFKAFPL